MGRRNVSIFNGLAPKAEAGRLIIGAMTTHAEVANSKAVQGALPALATQTPARDPKAEAHVVEWLKAAREQAPSVEALVAPKETSKAPRVVIVGRAYLGTNELANFERNVVEALPTLDVLALDIGWSAGEALTQWVSTGTGDLDLLLSESGTFGWSRTEARALIEGLHKRANKPAVVGIATGDPKAPCAAVLAFLGKVYPESLQLSG